MDLTISSKTKNLNLSNCEKIFAEIYYVRRTDDLFLKKLKKQVKKNL